MIKKIALAKKNKIRSIKILLWDYGKVCKKYSKKNKNEYAR